MYLDRYSNDKNPHKIECNVNSLIKYYYFDIVKMHKIKYEYWYTYF